MSELISGLIAGLLTLFVTPIFTKNNNDQNSLNTQSDWRKKLSELSYTESITLKELMKFRSCLSALRGFSVRSDDYNPLKNLDVERSDLRFEGNEMALDDTCLQYYDYILSHKHFCFMYDGGYGELNKLDKNHADVIRLLCLLLLKSDWNNKINKNKFFSFLDYKNRYEPAELKAIYIVTKSVKSDFAKHKDDPDLNCFNEDTGKHCCLKNKDCLYFNYYKHAIKIISKEDYLHFNKTKIKSNVKQVDKNKRFTIILFFIALFVIPLTSLLLIPISNYIYIYFFGLYFVFYFIFALFAITKNTEFKNIGYFIFTFAWLSLICSYLYILYLFLIYSKDLIHNKSLIHNKEITLFLIHNKPIISSLIVFLVLIVALALISIIITFLKSLFKEK